MYNALALQRVSPKNTLKEFAMGTTGTGRFADYPGPGRTRGAGETGEDRPSEDCTAPLTGIKLEDVAASPYFERAQALPEPGQAVGVRGSLYRKRMAVEVSQSGEVLGFLPTRFNYLLAYIRQGYRYEGVVISSSMRPIPSVAVNLGAARQG